MNHEQKCHFDIEKQVGLQNPDIRKLKYTAERLFERIAALNLTYMNVYNSRGKL